jgi:hypothetical protein
MKSTNGPKRDKTGKPRTIRKIILFSSVLACLLAAFLLLGYSYFNPGRYYYLDVVRMPIQSRIMSAAGDILLGDYYLPVDAIVPSPHAILFEEIEQHVMVLQTGDLFFTNSEKYISSRVTPGKWKHAGIYLGSRYQVREFFSGQPGSYKLFESFYDTGDELLILDASNKGVAIREITELSNLGSVSLLLGISAFRINRDPEDLQVFLAYAIDQLGKPYDYDLLLDDTRAIYCSELVYHGLSRIGIMLSITEQIFGREVISPNTAVEYILGTGIPDGEFTGIFLLEKQDGLLVAGEFGEMTAIAENAD